MQLWTIQPIDWYNKLLKESTIQGTEKYIDSSFLQPYHWLMNKMDEKIGKRPFSECYPIWAWYQYNDKKRRKPDLRSRAFLPKGTKGVRIEICKNENEVLLSDFELWHHPLNYWKIDDNEEETEEFDRLLEKNNIEFINREDYTPEIKQIIEKSWDKILDMNYAPEYSAQPFEKKSIQATFWTLSVSEIVKVEEFTAR